MPFGDRTGPEGRGSQTGRGLGDCNANTNNSDNSNNSDVNNTGVRGFFGRGFRNVVSRGFGRGRNRR